MTRLEFEVFTAAPIPDVYAYAANPENWVEWYPGTTQVEGAPAALPQVGDTWEETLKVAGLWIRFSWRATAVEPPQTWTLEGTGKIHGPFGLLLTGGTATLHYTLREVEGGTICRRGISYRYSNPLFRLVNRLLLKRKIAAEVEAGLQSLARIIEEKKRAMWTHQGGTVLRS